MRFRLRRVVVLLTPAASHTPLLTVTSAVVARTCSPSSRGGREHAAHTPSQVMYVTPAGTFQCTTAPGAVSLRPEERTPVRALDSSRRVQARRPYSPDEVCCFASLQPESASASFAA
jgi:hypothetical protein